jgi:hypothetical protein
MLTSKSLKRRSEMKKVELPLAEMGLIAATRAILGAGIGLLAGNRLSHSRRTNIGRTLIAIGALSTIPLAIDIISNRQKP